MCDVRFSVFVVWFVTSLAHADSLPPVRPTANSKPHAIEALHKLKAEFRKVPSKVIGAPEAPPPYQAERVLPDLKLTHTVGAFREPGSSRVILIEATSKKDDPTKLLRLDLAAEKKETTRLVDFTTDTAAFSVTFHPKFAENGFFYVGLNAPATVPQAETEKYKGKHTKVVRYTMERKAPFAVDPQSATVIIEWPSNGHNGAAVDFGRDGMLYVTSGDGTSDSDTNLTGQSLEHLLAKLMRLDVDHPAEGKQYSVPKDNPFVGQAGVRPETYAYGFRNPWRLFIDKQRDHIWIGQNGQDLWEQVYLVERGANYGWSVMEGGHVFYAERQRGPHPILKPTFDHPHSEARSLTGGIVYRGKKLPELTGAYLYADYSTGKIWAAKVDDNRKVQWHKEVADTSLGVTSFAEDADGELLITDYQGGAKGGLYTLVPNRSGWNADEFPKLLSQSGLFESVKGHRPHVGMIPYSVNAQLWSDGAHKERFIALPPEMVPRVKGKIVEGKDLEPSQIGYAGSRGWDFPENTVLVKSFAIETIEGKPESRQWIETRFLVKRDAEWIGYTYVWNAEQTDATLVGPAGEDREFEVRSANGTTTKQQWHYPSRAECMICHSRAARYVLGPTLVQMNKEHDYGGVIGNQLSVLDWLGAIKLSDGERRAAKAEVLKESGLSDADVAAALKKYDADKEHRPAIEVSAKSTRYPRLVDPYDKTADLAARARSYLHANCSHCHVEAGGGNAAMELEFSRTLDATKTVDIDPLHNRFGIKEAKVIAAGDPDRSVLLTRISRRGPNSGQMPQVATSKVDTQAVELIREWITSLKK